MEFVRENFPREYTIFVPGGGHGPLTTVDHLLNYTEHVISGTSTGDTGGRTGIQRKHGHPAGGDTAEIMRAHARDASLREMFDSFNGDTLYGNWRAISAMIDHLSKEHGFSGAIRMIEERLIGYKGRVIPNTDINLNLEVTLADGRKLEEHEIDELEAGSPPIVGRRVLPEDFPINDEYLYYAGNSEGIVIPPGTVNASLYLALCRKEIVEKMAKSSVPIIWACNAVNHIETGGWRAVDHAKFLIQDLGIPITHALLPKISYDLPPKYHLRGWEKVLGNGYKRGQFDSEVERDADLCRQLIPNVEVSEELTYPENFIDYRGPREVIRTNGELAAQRIIQILDRFYLPQTAGKPL